MKVFTKKRQIQMQLVPPRHPQANPAETFMKPLGKAMKIANFTKTSENEALQQLCVSYRGTPHSATDIAPAAMMFRDGQEGVFPKVPVSEALVVEGRIKDQLTKVSRQEAINEEKFRVHTKVTIGDTVLMRNYRRTSKFDPTFIPEAFEVIEIG